MRSHVLVRFGRWQDIIDEPTVPAPDLYLLTAAMQHYAKGVAHATLRDFARAEREREMFHRHLAGIPPERRFLSNPARASLGVGEALLDGELAYHQGRHEEAYAPAPGGRARRQSLVHRALGVDAPAAPCTGGAASRARSHRGGRSRSIATIWG